MVYLDEIDEYVTVKEYLNYRNFDQTKTDAIINKGYELINEINEES